MRNGKRLHDSPEDDRSRLVRRPRIMNEQLLEWVASINDLLEAGAVLLVEGKRDERALRSIGVIFSSNDQIVFVSPRRIHEVMDQLELREVETIVILTDLDKEGRAIASRIREEIDRRHGIRLENKPRKALFSFEQRICAIEDLYKLSLRLEALGLR